MESMGLMLARALAESWNRRWEEEGKSFLFDMAMAKIDARARANAQSRVMLCRKGKGEKRFPSDRTECQRRLLSWMDVLDRVGW